MQLLTNIVLIVQILSAVVMIGLVLIQHGKGADMGASFGSGASGSLFAPPRYAPACSSSAHSRWRSSRQEARCAAPVIPCSTGLLRRPAHRPQGSLRVQ
jgi:protein translocase SecG subunit